MSIFLLARCGEDENAPVYAPFPITAKISNYAEGPELSWTPIRSSDFVSYRIWRSATTDTIPTLSSGSISTSTANVVGFINESDKTTFVDQTFVNNGSVLPFFYYRIEAVLKNRSVWSKNIRSSEANGELNATINSVAFDNTTKKIYLFDQFGKKAIKFDSNKEEVEATYNLSSFSTLFSSFSKKNNKNELYIAQETSILVLDADKFTKIDEIDVKENIYHLSADNSGRIFVTALDKLIIVDRNNNNKQSFYNSASTSSGIYKYYFIPGTDQLLSVETASKFLTRILKLDASHTSVIGKEIEANLLGISSGISVNRALILSPDNFILGDRGYLFNRSLINLAKLNGQFSTGTIFKDIQALSSTSMIAILAAANSGTSFLPSVIRFQYPNTLVEEKFLNNSALPTFVIPMGDKNWLVLNRLTTGGDSYIAKLRN